LYTAYYNWTSGTIMQVLVKNSSDGGATWSTAVHVAASRPPGDEFFPWLTTNATGTVGVTWLDRRLDPSNINYDCFASTSTNGGASFTPNKRVTTVSSNPN